MKIKTIALLSLAIILVLGFGVSYFDEIGIAKEENEVEQVTLLNNYEISPPEIKNYGEKLQDG